MARKSESALEVAPVVDLDRRLPAPAELSAYEAQIWSAIVATKPGDWFQADCAPILLAYCKHISTAATLDQKIGEFNPDAADKADWATYLGLMDARRKETGKVESCATKLRLTPQARYDTQKAAVADRKASGPKKLWEQ